MGVLGAVSRAGTDSYDAIILVVFGVLGYLYAVRTRRVIGTTPWRLPPITWALVSALLPLWGLMLEMVARLTTRHAQGVQPPGGGGGAGFGQPGYRSGPYPPGPYGQVPPGAPPAAGSYGPYGAPPVGAPPSAFPGPNGPTGAEPWPVVASPRPGPDGWLPGNETPPPLFGWYKDPDGAHEERYWDGRLWSEMVRDEGAVTTAPLAPSRPFWETAQMGVGSSEGSAS